ncbi:MAG TPA: MFS transporter [Ramlibacter sp.]|jgi:MFS family permease|uniref:MFS transporter n=1 Tax=Ramlibacter sp. TaxID=1917967 RepID=UPI002D6906C8|nr:MFS transporter [Ramlibacter sp.]HZY18824.1 MFS transporter [Ramlibacter sp.]
MAAVSLFHHPAFLRFWLARLLGTGAQQMLMLAIGWQMYGLTGSAWDLGLVGLAQFAPSLAAALPAGHAADRFHRARLVLACYALQGAVALLLLAATQGGWASRGVLLGLSLVLGGLRPFQMAAQQALLPALVPPELLARAMALGSAGIQAAVIGGPALAGLLFAGGVGVVYGTCFGLFAAGCVALAAVRYEHAPPAREPPTLASLLAGVRFIGGNRVLLGAVSLDLFAVLLGGATALLPIFAADILHVGPTGLGLLRSAPAVGALVMAAALARWPLARQVGRKLLLAVAVYGACMVVFGLSTSFLLSLLVLAVSGAADMVSVIVRQTLAQIETPDAMRGRVAAVNTLFIGASNQLGEFESGATAALMGPVGSVVAGGFGTLVVAGLWLRWFGALVRRDRFQEP